MKLRNKCLLALTVVGCSAASKGETPSTSVSDNSSQALTAASSTAQSTQGNPFVNAHFTLNRHYVAQVQATAAKHPSEAAALAKVAASPTAVWLDSIASTSSIGAVLDGAAEQAAGKQPPVTVFVVYDLPNRDCSAKSSAGELSVEAGGEERYKREFIDPIAQQFARYPDQHIVAIVEPDSLPNLATNMSVAKCAQSERAYRSSIAYAVSKLSMPNVSVYLDAAHAGWLGWNGNRTKIANIFKEVLAEAGGADRIRGFATNVSNFNTLDKAEGKKLGPYNPCPDELTYIGKLSEELRRVGIANKHFIIDTARNGRPVRKTWGSWCNVVGAGLGARPIAAPQALVDAYFWIKPPGESDGVSDPSQPRFDASCQSEDSAENAPQAGQWFEAYLLELVRNADPTL